MKYSLAANPRQAGGIGWGVLAAISLWLGFPNDIIDLPLLAILWPAGLAMSGAMAPSAISAFKRGWLASFAGMSAALYWLSLPVHYVGGLAWPLAGMCALLIAACLAIYGGLFASIAQFERDLPYWRKALALALAWYLLEYLFALLTGFPWLPLSGALAVWPVMIQAADVTGAYFCSALWLWAVLLGIYAFANKKFIAWRRLFCGIVICAALLSYGVWRLKIPPYDKAPDGADSIAALFVEGNVDQNQKWVPAFQRQTLDLYIDLTKGGLEDVRRQGITQPLILWPETALPFFFETRPQLAAVVRENARIFNCPLLFGAPGLERTAELPEGAIFNRAFLIGPDGSILGHYDKEHLVPFGEYLPSWLDLDFLKSLLQGVGIYKEGSATNPLHYGTLALGMLICYEGIFPWLAQRRVEQGANILADISNDGWFGKTPAARQHLFLTIPRCVEQNRWLLRATNTGISAVVDNRGRTVMTGPMFVAGWLTARARICGNKSFFHEYGHFVPWFALGLCIALSLSVRIRRQDFEKFNSLKR